MPPTETSPPDCTSCTIVPPPPRDTAGVPAGSDCPLAQTEPPTFELALVPTASLAATEATSELPGPASLVESKASVVRLPEASSELHAHAAKRKWRSTSPVHWLVPGRGMGPLVAQKDDASLGAVASSVRASVTPPLPLPLPLEALASPGAVPMGCVRTSPQPPNEAVTTAAGATSERR